MNHGAIVVVAVADVNDATVVVSSHLAAVVAILCFAVGFPAIIRSRDHFQPLRLLEYFKMHINEFI